MKSNIFAAMFIAVVAIEAAQAQKHRNDDNYTYNSYDDRKYNDYNYGTLSRNRLEAMHLEDLHYFTRQRIERGIDRGLLTRSEARNLVNDFEKIDKKIWKAQRNRFFSRNEQRDIRKELLSLNDRIAWEKNDNDRYGRNRHDDDNRRRW